MENGLGKWTGRRKEKGGRGRVELAPGEKYEKSAPVIRIRRI